MKQCMERLYNGIIKENPTFVLMLGMCPTLAVTTSAINGLGMGLSTMVVLALSNLMISAMRKIIPDKVRIPAYIVIIATFVTLVELLLHAYVPALHESLGIYISLIVVNCIILGRAESYASKNKMMPSLFDGIGMGLGFTLALTLIGLVREFLGAGTVFGISGPDLYGTSLPELIVRLINQWLDPNSTSETVQLWNRLLTDEISSFSPMGIMVMAPGAFFILAILTAIQNVIKEKGKKAGKDVSKIQSGCNSDCMNCKDSSCAKYPADDGEVISEESESLQVDGLIDEGEHLQVDVLKDEDECLQDDEKQEENNGLQNDEKKKESNSLPVDEINEESDSELSEETVVEEVSEETAIDLEDNNILDESMKEVDVVANEDNEDIVTQMADSQKEEQVSAESVAEEPKKEKKHKMTLLEATQEIDIVELEELLGEEEDNADE
ncbi:MAG: electron transport complex subunit RsxE [Lachnospiraceae bacterium]|nr:electron transport complex subunit RsxE [Lachnospiraceae bacterium]